MTINRKEVVAFQGVNVQASGADLRMPPFTCDKYDQFMLLIDIGEGGTVDHAASLVFTPLFIDDDGHEYVNANTTWGTFTILGSAASSKIAVNGPVLSKQIGLRVVSAGTLTSSNYFVLGCRVVFMSNTGV